MLYVVLLRILPFNRICGFWGTLVLGVNVSKKLKILTSSYDPQPFLHKLLAADYTICIPLKQKEITPRNHYENKQVHRQAVQDEQMYHETL